MECLEHPELSEFQEKKDSQVRKHAKYLPLLTNYLTLIILGLRGEDGNPGAPGQSGLKVGFELLDIFENIISPFVNSPYLQGLDGKDGPPGPVRITQFIIKGFISITVFKEGERGEPAIISWSSIIPEKGEKGLSGVPGRIGPKGNSGLRGYPGTPGLKG